MGTAEASGRRVTHLQVVRLGLAVRLLSGGNYCGNFSLLSTPAPACMRQGRARFPGFKDARGKGDGRRQQAAANKPLSAWGPHRNRLPLIIGPPARHNPHSPHSNGRPMALRGTGQAWARLQGLLRPACVRPLALSLVLLMMALAAAPVQSQQVPAGARSTG